MTSASQAHFFLVYSFFFAGSSMVFGTSGKVLQQWSAFRGWSSKRLSLQHLLLFLLSSLQFFLLSSSALLLLFFLVFFILTSQSVNLFINFCQIFKRNILFHFFKKLNSFTSFIQNAVVGAQTCFCFFVKESDFVGFICRKNLVVLDTGVCSTLRNVDFNFLIFFNRMLNG